MKIRALDRRSMAIALAFGVATALAGCGSKEQPAATAAPPPAAAVPAPAAPPAPVPTPAAATAVANATWTPEALEDLLAPVALYPDPVLSQVLIASTNPQEVLDAGNWLIANESLKGKSLDDGAAQAGFTPPIRALVQFPQTIDQMCMEMGWTTELGEAFVADQAGVLDAVQRLRKQAIDVGNLQTSPAMLVETQQQEGQDVVVLKPPQPGVVYVPTYDPQTAYAPLPASVPQTTTVTPVETDKKYTTGNMVTTGVLAFGAGILVNELFDDDNNNKNKNNGYYYPNYGYGGMPYYPPYPYRPSYGGGYYPSNNYNRPPNYNNGGFQNNGNIVITNPGGGGNGGYWDRYPNRPGSGQNGYNNNNYRQPRNVNSPITSANPKRKDLTQLNQRQPRPMPADVKRPSPNATAANWKGQQSYAGKNKNKGPSSNMSPQERINSATPSYSRPASNKRPDSKVSPKVSGSYAGMNKANRPSTGGMPTTRDMQNNGNRDMQRPQQKPMSRDMPKKNGNRDMQRPQAKPMPAGDRGYGSKDMQRPMPANKPMNRPSPNMNQGGKKGNKGTAMSGADGNHNAGAASQRGKQSMPQGARSKGGGGGGGKKQGR